jgi:hypothetical protein
LTSFLTNEVVSATEWIVFHAKLPDREVREFLLFAVAEPTN